MSERIEKLVKELRMVSNMINMGEKIRWGQETFLMDRAADTLTQLEAERDEAVRRAMEADFDDELFRKSAWYKAEKAMIENEAVRRALEGERKRLRRFVGMRFLKTEEAVELQAEIMKALTSPTSDISSDNNNGS